MTPTAGQEITEYLERARAGDPEALHELLPVIYRQLRSLARHHLRHRRGPDDLGTESLVHEAYLRLAQVDLESHNRAQFFALASKAMRTLLVDNARRNGRLKRGGDQQALQPATGQLDQFPARALFSQTHFEEVLALDRALDELQQEDPQLIEIVECRFFGGLTVEETASTLGISAPTVKRRWAAARVRLFTSIGAGITESPC